MSEDYSPIIYGVCLIIGGVAMSYVSPKDIVSKQPIHALFFVSIVCTMSYCYIYIMLSIFGATASPGYLKAFNTIANLSDAITGVCLETCYILRLVACARMFKRRKLIYLLFIFPGVYVITDALAIANYYLETPVNIIQSQWGMFNFMLMIGDIISHVATVTILLRNAGNLKDPREKRDLEIVAAAALSNQALFLIFCCISFGEITYSTALIYFSWTMDHIVFCLVNRHIRLFLSSRGYSDGNSSHASKSIEMDSKISSGGAIAHERVVSLVATEV